MSDGKGKPQDGISQEQLNQANARYKPFPGFDEWSSIRPDKERWSQASQNLENRKDEASAEILEASLKSALRAAAVDSGAIEGLHETDRGFTFTVATQLEAWRAAADERGDNVGDLIEAQIEAYEMAVDVANQKQPMSETWIRQIHEVVTTPQETYRVFTDAGWQDAMATALNRLLSEAGLPPNLNAEVSLTQNSWSPELQGYRNSVASPRQALVLSLRSRPRFHQPAIPSPGSDTSNEWRRPDHRW